MLQRLRKRVKGKDWPIRHRNCSRWKERQKDTFDLNSFYNFYEMELSKKTNRPATQKDQENICEFQFSILNIGLHGNQFLFPF